MEDPEKIISVSTNQRNYSKTQEIDWDPGTDWGLTEVWLRSRKQSTTPPAQTKWDPR